MEHSGQQLASGHYWAYVQRGLHTPAALQSCAVSSPHTQHAPCTPRGHPTDPPNCCGDNDAGEAGELREAKDSWDDITATLLSSPVKGSPTKSSTPINSKLKDYPLDNAFRGMPNGGATSNHEQTSLAQDADESSSNEEPACQWYYASDSHVNKVSKERVLACEAYILLYMRVN